MENGFNEKLQMMGDKMDNRMNAFETHLKDIKSLMNTIANKE